jgi:16S rRNA (uracil1498-N3)-methyltransferase
VLFDGSGYDYRCKTLDADPKKTRLTVEIRDRIDNESSLTTTLIQGVSRHDRMDTSIQKAVELGVNRIIPLICQRSNYRSSSDKSRKKREHWKKVAISACEQSGRSRIPEIMDIISLDDVFQTLDTTALKILLNPYSRNTLKDIDCQHESIEVVVGPEGGLSETEIEALESERFASVCFGPRILRTETTGPAVLSAIQVLWGDL